MTDGRTHRFTLVFDGIDVSDERVLDALFAGGCDDALFGVRDGEPFADFERPGETLPEAVVRAVAEIGSVAPGARLTRIEPTSLVSLAAIADRVGLTREAVRLYATGHRGRGGFPSPVNHIDGVTRLWWWPDVARWLEVDDRGTSEAFQDAEWVELVNTSLRAALARTRLRPERIRAANTVIAASRPTPPATPARHPVIAPNPRLRRAPKPR